MYKITINQDLKYNETLIGKTKTFDAAINVAREMLNNFDKVSITIRLVSDEEKEENEEDE